MVTFNFPFSSLALNSRPLYWFSTQLLTMINGYWLMEIAGDTTYYFPQMETTRATVWSTMALLHCQALWLLEELGKLKKCLFWIHLAQQPRMVLQPIGTESPEYEGNGLMQQKVKPFAGINYVLKGNQVNVIPIQASFQVQLRNTQLVSSCNLIVIYPFRRP